MALALALGRRGQGAQWPWPSVGCVLVKDGRVVGRGCTDRATMRHAEVVALDQAGPAAQGATAFVTLEPCSHHGTVGPCADALIAAGVARVVAATGDPNPKVDGAGFAKLRAAGIVVDTGVQEHQARQDLAGFLSVVHRGRPRVTLKLALSADGRIATASGDSQWITGPAARRRVHAERLAHDAVMVGGGTARADDPSLTVRDLGAARSPLRIIAARRLDFDGAGLIQDLPQVPVWLAHGPNLPADRRKAWTRDGVELLEIPAHGRSLDLAAMVQAFGARGLTSVYCEGGGTLAAGLIHAGLVDDLVIYSAGVLIGAEGQPGLGALGLDILADAPRFQLVDHSQVGADIRSHWRPVF